MKSRTPRLLWLILVIQLLYPLNVIGLESNKDIKIGIQYISETGKIVFSVSNTSENPVEIFNPDLKAKDWTLAPMGLCVKLKGKENEILSHLRAGGNGCITNKYFESSLAEFPSEGIIIAGHQTVEAEIELQQLVGGQVSLAPEASEVKYIQLQYMVFFDGYYESRLFFATDWLPYSRSVKANVGIVASNAEYRNKIISEAIQYRETKKLEDLLLGGVDPNFKDKDGNTPLRRAAWGKPEIVKMLLKFGADPNIQDRFGRTPLFNAARGGHLGIFRMLLEKNASTNVIDKNGESLLHWAVWKNEEIVKVLLNKGMNPNQKNKLGATPLHEAANASLDNVKIVSLLLKHGADPNLKDINGKTPLFYAVDRGNEGIVKMLFKAGADSNARNRWGMTSLHEATKNLGRPEIVKMLLAHGADIKMKDMEGGTPLFYAATRGYSEVINILLAKGGGSDFKNMVAEVELHHAAKEGSVKKVKLLLEQGTNPNSKEEDRRQGEFFGTTPLFGAALMDDTEMFNLLLKKEGDPKARGGKGETILHWVARLGNEEIFDNLLERGVDPSIKAKNGDTILHWATKGGNTKMISKLLNYGYGPNVFNQDDETPIFNAIRKDYNNKARDKSFSKVVGELLANGADINIQNQDGDTPLHIAVKWSRAEIVKLLLEKGANPNAINHDGETPLSWTGKNKDIEDLLKSYGAKPWG